MAHNDHIRTAILTVLKELLHTTGSNGIAIVNAINQVESEVENSLPFGADSFEVTARNANDDPTTIEYSRDGNLVKTVTITYTAGGDVDTYTAT